MEYKVGDIVIVNDEVYNKGSSVRDETYYNKIGTIMEIRQRDCYPIYIELINSEVDGVPGVFKENEIIKLDGKLAEVLYGV